MGISQPGDNHPDDEKPQYLIDLEELQDTGGLERVANLIETKADVWIKRSNGEWQFGKVWEMGHAGLSVGLEWFDEAKQKIVGKHVATKVFLQWQDEQHD